jgi:hypothetical protein
MECKGSLPFAARHWPLSWDRWINSIFASLNMQNTQHQYTFTLHGKDTQNGIYIPVPWRSITSGDVAAANMWWHTKKSSADAKSFRNAPYAEWRKHSLASEVSVITDHLLSDQELALVTTQFIRSVIKMQGTDKLHWFEIQLQAMAVVVFYYIRPLNSY